MQNPRNNENITTAHNHRPAKITLTIPLDLQLPITIVTRIERHRLLIISVTSGDIDSVDATPADISQLSWNIGGIYPKKKLVLDNGLTVLLGFAADDVRPLNLELLGTMTNRCDFLGTDLLSYIETSSDFGEIIGTDDAPGCYDKDDDEITHRPDNQLYPAIAGATIGAVLIGLVAMANATRR